MVGQQRCPQKTGLNCAVNRKKLDNSFLSVETELCLYIGKLFLSSLSAFKQSFSPHPLFVTQPTAPRRALRIDLSFSSIVYVSPRRDMSELARRSVTWCFPLFHWLWDAKETLRLGPSCVRINDGLLGVLASKYIFFRICAWNFDCFFVKKTTDHTQSVRSTRFWCKRVLIFTKKIKLSGTFLHFRLQYLWV